MSWFKKLKTGLSKSSDKMTDGIGSIFTKRKLDEQTLEELEDLLISADLGAATAAKIVASFSKNRFDTEISPDEVKEALAEEIANILEPVAIEIEIDKKLKPQVIMMVGVNGNGKTTTLGKMAMQYKKQGKKIMIAACDTFRAAAVEQVSVWGERTNCPVITGPQNSDPASVAYSALEKAKNEGYDILLIDTAGRLQNKTGLMEELAKTSRVMKKIDETKPDNIILVLDATTGQNAHSQVETFKDLVDISGIIVTKLDGTAKGGVVVALAEKFKLPIHAVGVGEGIDDLNNFNANDFAHSLMDSNNRT